MRRAREEASSRREQGVQRPWVRNVFGLFKGPEGGQDGWDEASDRQQEEKEAGENQGQRIAMVQYWALFSRQWIGRLKQGHGLYDLLFSNVILVAV